MKKLLVYALVLSVFGSIVFSGCRKTQTGSETTPKKTSFMFFGDKDDRMAEFVAKDLPEYLKKKGLNIEVELMMVPWSETNVRDVRLAAGEDFSSFVEPDTLSRWLSKGLLTETTPYLNQYGANIKREVDQSSYDWFTVDGRCYSIPMGNMPNASEFYAVTVRQDLLEETGMKEIKTLDDIEKFVAAGLKLHPGYSAYGGQGDLSTYGAFRMLTRVVSDKNIYLINGLVFADAAAKDDRVYSYLESEEFKTYTAIARKWNRLGIISPRQMSDSMEPWSKMLAGQGLFYDGTAGRTWENLPSIKEAVPDGKLKNYFIGDAKGRPLISKGTYAAGFFISANAKNPEAYVQLINACYENQESFDFFIYGVQGVDYELNADGKFKTRNSSQEFFNDWAANISKWLRFDAYVDDDVIDEYRNWDQGSILQKDIGFVFNLDPVSVEYAQIENVVSEYIYPIVYGFVDYDTAWPEAQRRLKAAGIDKYIAEFQKQFSEFYKGKN
jgi:putative aldouronate transport system substrate-binding protein